MTKELQDIVYRLKPSWFENLNYGFECGDGWFILLHELTLELVLLEVRKPQLFEGFKVAQVKEKFGGLRFYIDVAPELMIPKELYDLIEKYENKSFNVCELCGKPAKLRTLGYIRTLCRFPHE